MSHPYTIAADQLRALSEASMAALEIRPARSARIVSELRRRSRLRQVYDATPPRVDLCDFDAQGMDIIEGRRA